MHTTEKPTSLPDAQQWAEAVVDTWRKRRTHTVPPLVLVVDDDEATREVLCEKLVHDGFHVATVCNGKEALQFLERGLDDHDETFCPDLVISDVRMPAMSGLELVEKLGEAAPLLPTILITGFGDAHLREQALRVGCDQVLFKPFDYTDLREHVRRLLLASALVPEFNKESNQPWTQGDSDWSPYE